MTLNPYLAQPYVALVIRYMRYVLNSRFNHTGSNLPIIHLPCMYAPIGIVHMMNGFILDRVAFWHF